MVERLFGTNGVRGVINEKMTAGFALDLGRAIGEYMGGEVALGTDTRTSAHMLKSAVAAGLMWAGVDVLDLGVLPTPALQFFVKNHQVAGGVMITASHNPPEFNGIKCIDADGTELPREKEEMIENIFYRRSFNSISWREVGQMRGAGGAIESYSSSVLSHVDVTAIGRAGLRVALDCANGAGSLCTPDLLDRMGVRTITLNCNPLGTFPGHPSEPTPENLKELITLVRESSLDLGVAHDGDADRTIFVDNEGNYVYGDRILALVARYVIEENGGGAVVTPVSSSSCVEEVVREAGGTVIYTKVGAPLVARKMIETGAIFGGEENGGLIFPEHQYCRDGAMTAAKVLEILAKHGTLSDLLSDIPAYFLDKRKVPCPDSLKGYILGKMKEMAEDNKVDETDGVKIYFDDGWTLIRPSGTEPLFRIFSEGRTEMAARNRGEYYERIIKALISSELKE